MKRHRAAWQKIALHLSVLLLIGAGLVQAADTAGIYQIESVEVHQKVDDFQEGPWQKRISNRCVILPHLEVSLKTNKDLKSQDLYLHAYFYDAQGKLIQTYNQPSRAVQHGQLVGEKDNLGYILAKVLEGGKTEKAYFTLPLHMTDGWKAVVVLGSKKAAVAFITPTGQASDFAFPEKDLVKATAVNPALEDDANIAFVPLIERIAITDNPSYPKFTLFLHLPHGVTDAHNVKGVVAQCVLSNSAQAIRDSLNSIKPEGDPRPMYAFAESHQMAILAWGGAEGYGHDNYDEIDHDRQELEEDRFQLLADGWEKAMLLLARDYGLPDHDFLLSGGSSAGTWACRIALHKPNRFLAVHIHVASKYEAPSPEAKRILWLLTSGELDPGADRALRFFADVKKLQYPVVFKSFIGLGHRDSPDVDRLATRFFDYALSLKRPIVTSVDPKAPAPDYDFSNFNVAPYYGDAVNQEMFPAPQKDMIPSGFLVPLPNKEIADAWKK